MPTYLVFKKVYSMLPQIFQLVLHSVTFLKNDKAKFRAALRKYLYTHFLYYVNEFFRCKDDLRVK